VLDSESARVLDVDGTATGGRATVAELGAGAQYQRGPLRADAAGGLALPIGLGAEPWPEAKLALRLQPPHTPTALKLTVGRKGRVPTLRERYRLDIGNAGLGPEKVSFAELAVELGARGCSFTTAGWLRQTTGLIRYDADRSQLINTGDLQLVGIDARVALQPGPLGAGGSYSYTDAHSALLGGEPLDFVPHHRAEGWLSARRGDRLGGTLRVAWLSTQIDRQTDLPAYTSVELAMFARLGRRLTGTARIGNLTDTDYLLRMGVPGTGRTATLALQGVWE
jgi:outer membrane receptor protein involved in Fe transport